MNRIKVYVAGGSSEVKRVRAVVSCLQTFPFLDVSTEWLDKVEAGEEGNESGDSAHETGLALADLDAITLSNLVILVQPKKPSLGAAFETGYAYALDIPTVILANPDGLRPTIFWTMIDSTGVKPARLSMFKFVKVYQAAQSALISYDQKVAQ